MFDGFSRRCFFESELVARWRRKAGEPSSTSVSGSVSFLKPHWWSVLVPPLGLRRRKEKGSAPSRFASVDERCWMVMARPPYWDAERIIGEYNAPKVIVFRWIGKFHSPLARLHAQSLDPGASRPRCLRAAWQRLESRR